MSSVRRLRIGECCSASPAFTRSWPPIFRIRSRCASDSPPSGARLPTSTRSPGTLRSFQSAACGRPRRNRVAPGPPRGDNERLMTRSFLLLSGIALAGAVAVHAQMPQGRGRGEAAPAAPAPPPGSAGIYKSDAELTAALKRAIGAANGEQSSAAIGNTDQYRVNLVHREKAANALAHPGNTELHYIIEG